MIDIWKVNNRTQQFFKSILIRQGNPDMRYNEPQNKQTFQKPATANQAGYSRHGIYSKVWGSWRCWRGKEHFTDGINILETPNTTRLKRMDSDTDRLKNSTWLFWIRYTTKFTIGVQPLVKKWQCIQSPQNIFVQICPCTSSYCTVEPHTEVLEFIPTKRPI